MARAKIDLNRFRKVYPQLKRSPRMFSAELRPYKITFSNADSGTVDISNFTTPVIVVSHAPTAATNPNNPNVNLWIANISQLSAGNWRVTVEASSQFSGEVHVHVGEAFV